VNKNGDYSIGDGAIRLYRGDCLEVMNHIETGSVDMVMADLPYG